jgi:elongation factor G
MAPRLCPLHFVWKSFHTCFEGLVLFRETIRIQSEAEYEWKRHFGPKGEYARLKVQVTPLPRGSGLRLVPINTAFFPEEYFPAVEQGFLIALAAGPVGGYEVTDLEAVVIGGSHHEVDSSWNAFQKAAEQAMREALQSGEAGLLEPTLIVTVTGPEEYLGVVIGSLNSLRGRIEEVEHVGEHQRVRAAVPQIEMTGFGESLVSQTLSRASFVTEPGGYDYLPTSIVRTMRSCPECRLKVLPNKSSNSCPRCGSQMGFDGDSIAV